MLKVVTSERTLARNVKISSESRETLRSPCQH